jgi:hypothetical protein
MLLVARQQRQPVVISGPNDHKPGVQNILLGVVRQWPAVEFEDFTTGLFDHGLRSRSVPFRGWPEARVDVGPAFGDDAKFQRATHGYHVCFAQAFEESIQATSPV